MSKNLHPIYVSIFNFIVILDFNVYCYQLQNRICEYFYMCKNKYILLFIAFLVNVFQEVLRISDEKKVGYIGTVESSNFYI